MSFDIDERADALAIEDDGVVISILDENDEPALKDDGSPVTITMAGMNSQRYRKAEAWQRKAIRAFGRMMTGDEQLTMQSEFIARCVIAWDGFTSKGVLLALTIENIVNVFTKLAYVQRQAERGMGDRARFLVKG